MDAFCVHWIVGVQFRYVYIYVHHRGCSGGISFFRMSRLRLLLMEEGQRFLYIRCDEIPSLLRAASEVLISLVVRIAGMTTLSDYFATAFTASSPFSFIAVGFMLLLILK